MRILNSLTVPKNVKWRPFCFFFKHQFCCKISNKLKRDPLETLIKNFRKSLTQPASTEKFWSSVRLEPTSSAQQTSKNPLRLLLTIMFHSADDNVTWAGYSEEGDAAVAFSSGPLYLLKKSASGSSGHCWMPVFNARHQLSSKTDRLWIVGVAGSQLRAVYCKASKFPAQLPKPILLTYPLGQ